MGLLSPGGDCLDAIVGRHHYLFKTGILILAIAFFDNGALWVLYFSLFPGKTMSKLDLEWLAVFDEVYKTGSVSKAADRLGIAQAAASTMLNKLRRHFDD